MLVRSDGMPLYLLASVVDDAELGVTHAIVPTFPPDQLADIGRALNDAYG